MMMMMIMLLYAPCVALADNTEPSVSVSPSFTPAELAEACSDSYTSLNGAEICAEMCAPARCCFTEPTANDSWCMKIHVDDLIHVDNNRIASDRT